jgi:hypothetical protein
LYYGRQKPLAEILSNIKNITLEEVQGVATDMFRSDLMNLAAIGPFEEKNAPLVPGMVVRTTLSCEPISLADHVARIAHTLLTY